MNHKFLAALLLPLLFASACRKDEIVMPAEYDIIGTTASPDSKIRGFYLVNEGNMGSNKCTLDFCDYAAGTYYRNIYAERNPDVIKELGDVGNDIDVYGSRLYVVVNCSHKVEVLDARTGVRIGSVDIPNCRYVSFRGGKAYVSSYVGPVHVDPDAPKGAVYEVDTTSLAVGRKVTVGYQPEEMEFVDDCLYVANSGGYRAPLYDSTVSVVSMPDFRQVRLIAVGPNLHRLKKDRYGKLWVAGRGDYGNCPSRLYVLEKSPGSGRMEVTDTIAVACSDMAIKGDSLYCIASGWNNATASGTVAYAVIDVRTKKVVSDNFITDGTEKDIARPYGIAVHPETGEILLTDAKNYVSSGALHCYSPQGKRLWSVRTGDIPAHIAFLPK